MSINSHQEPENRLRDFFLDPAKHKAVAEAVMVAAGGDHAVHPPGDYHMLPGPVRSHFVRAFDKGDGFGLMRGILGLDFIERIAVYYPVYSRKSARAPHCQDLAELILAHITKSAQGPHYQDMTKLTLTHIAS